MTITRAVVKAAATVAGTTSIVLAICSIHLLHYLSDCVAAKNAVIEQTTTTPNNK